MNHSSCQTLAKLFIPIFFIWHCHNLQAQEPVMIHYTIDDGLPSNTVYNIYPDSKGHLWFATDKGVARYNGLTFEIFTTEDGLGDNENFFFQEDCDGRLWLGSFNGKLCYFKHGTFHNEENTTWLKRLPQIPSLIRYITIEKDSSVTILSDSAPYFFNIKGEHVTIIPLRTLTKLLGNTLNQYRYPKASYISKLDKNLYRFDGYNIEGLLDSTGKCVHWATNNRHYHPVFSTSRFMAFYSFNDTIYDRQGFISGILKNGLEDNHFFFLQDQYATFIGRDEGLFINDSIHLFNNNRITSITKDFQGNYWISNYKNGVYKLSHNFLSTRYYSQAYDGKVSNALTILGQCYFITGNGKIYKENKDSGKFDSIYSNELIKTSYSSSLHSINADLTASIWGDNGIWFIKDLNNKPIAKKVIGDDKQALYPKGLFQNQEYTYRVGVGNIIQIHNKDFKLASPLYKHNKSLIKYDTLFTIVNKRINSSAMDEHGHLWFSVRDSIFKIIHETVQFQFSQKKEVFRKMLVRDNYVITYTDNNLLIIFNTNKSPAQIDTIRNKKFLWENMVFIDDTHLLLSTNRNYYLLSIPGYELRPLENIFLPRQAEYIYADENYCYFFKESNITRVEKSFLYEEPAPKVFFSTFNASNKLYHTKPVIKLSFNEARNIKLSFIPISFSSKELSYQYSLSDDGKDHWQNTEGTELNLLVPSYGTYTIKVRAKTISSSYSQPDTITLIISRPYWATWWFWATVILSIVALTWWAVRIRTRRLLRKKQLEFEAEKKYQQAEYKALNALMNPHFIFNSMNNIQGLINEDAKQTANEYLVIFSEMIRQNMHNIDQGTISLFKELILCRNYLELEKLRFRELVNYNIEIAEDVDTEDIMIPPLMIQPLIENAIRHGLLPKESTDSKVSIRIFERGNELNIEVEDNGIGLTKAAESKSSLHQSVGLGNMRKRIEHIQKIQQRTILFTIEELFYPDASVKGTLAVIKIMLD